MEQRPHRKSESSRRADRIVQQRTLWIMGILGLLVFLALFAKLFDLQIFQHEELEEKALLQQTRSVTVSASRGTIYDRNGNILAISATAETVFVSPLELLNAYKDQYGDDYEPYYEEGKATLAAGLSEILEVEEETILTKLEKTNRQYEVIRRQVDEDMAAEVREFLNEVDIDGVHLVADAKRYYPYGSLAAHVIGFVGADGYGMYGLEATQNDALEGTPGLVVSAKSNDGTDLLYQYEQYYDPENGDSLVSTLDTTIQYYLEQGLQTLENRFGTGKGATGIVMDVNTGAILAMASYPTYDLNDPWTIYDEGLAAELEELAAPAAETPESDDPENDDPESDDPETDEQTAEERYNAKKRELQLLQWRNKSVNDTYEPGSTFKMITLAAALEEGVVDLSSTFTCTGSTRVPGYTEVIKCSSKRGHGLQTLTEATGNSCNPAFINIGLRVGTEKYYEYLKAFGLLEKTGVELNGETSGIAALPDAFNNLDLACYAFGQNINVTPVALIAAQAACVNGGYLRTPYLVEQVLDQNGEVKMQHDSTPVRQVISEETSETMRGILEYVVSNGSGKNGQVAGYRIGGKTGTADKGNTGDVVVSFVCFAPADDPQIMMLMTLDTPSRTTGTYVSGGQMVAPVASTVMAEILPYLGIKSDVTAAADTTVPNVIGLSREEAESKLQAKELSCRFVGSGDTVTDQTPVGGAIIPVGATVVLYCGAEKSDEPCTVPNVIGMTAAQANKALTNAGLIMKVTGASNQGSVYAIQQSLAEGTEVPAGTVVTVQFGDNSLLD
ncbi:MAG: penicillin-binding transpeptidase domain-containing protein [Oscillospiraceae bacterium]